MAFQIKRQSEHFLDDWRWEWDQAPVEVHHQDTPKLTFVLYDTYLPSYMHFDSWDWDFQIPISTYNF